MALDSIQQRSSLKDRPLLGACILQTEPLYLQSFSDVAAPLLWAALHISLVSSLLQNVLALLSSSGLQLLYLAGLHVKQH